jgi:hypothetical protein
MNVPPALTVKDGATTVAPVTEIDFTAGAVVSSLGAGRAGVAVSGGGGALVGLTAYLAGTQTVTNNAGTQVVALDTALSDPAGYFAAPRIVIPAGKHGRYLLSAKVQGSDGTPTNITELWGVAIALNGTTLGEAIGYAQYEKRSFGYGNDIDLPLPAFCADLADGDVLRLLMFMQTQAGRSEYLYSTAAPGGTFLSILKIS